jgi:phage terminase small subunit
MTNLTPKQDMFCREYLIDFNGTQAAIRAGYSKKTASSIAEENLRKPDIAAHLSESIRAREIAVDRDGEEVLMRLWEIADFRLSPDAGEVVDGEFKISDSEAWSEATKRAIRSIKSTKTIRRVGQEEIEEIVSSLKAPDVMPALVELMKHHGLNSEFNTAIACLRKYGLWCLRDKDGGWTLEDRNKSR